MKNFRAFLKKKLAQWGYRFEKLPIDFEPAFMALHERVKDFTMTSLERQYALSQAVEYIVKNNIEGDIVECGVWKGGARC